MSYWGELGVEGVDDSFNITGGESGFGSSYSTTPDVSFQEFFVGQEDLSGMVGNPSMPAVTQASSGSNEPLVAGASGFFGSSGSLVAALGMQTEDDGSRFVAGHDEYVLDLSKEASEGGSVQSVELRKRDMKGGRSHLATKYKGKVYWYHLKAGLLKGDQVLLWVLATNGDGIRCGDNKTIVNKIEKMVSYKPFAQEETDVPNTAQEMFDKFVKAVTDLFFYFSLFFLIFPDISRPFLT